MEFLGCMSLIAMLFFAVVSVIAIIGGFIFLAEILAIAVIYFVSKKENRLSHIVSFSVGSAIFFFLLLLYLHRFVVIGEENDFGLMFGGLGGGVKGEDHDGHQVSGQPAARCSAIEAEGTGTARCGNRVGLDAAAVVVVDDENFLIGQDARHFEVFFVNCHTSLVVEVALRDLNPMELGFKKLKLHKYFGSG